MSEGCLFVCATPIGNLGDISARLGETLEKVDVIYAEDTRRVAKLLAHLGIDKPVRLLFSGNEQERSAELIAAVEEGRLVALVSDAGTPVVSDPGAAAVRAALDGGLRVSVVPGPSAVTSAVAVSGMSGDRFVFEGFLPKKGERRRRRLEEMASDRRPVVLFITPHRLERDLEDLAACCGLERRVVIARELTKLNEEIWAGPLSQALDRFADGVKGEITVVVEPAADEPVSSAAAMERARALVSSGVSVSEAARRASEETGFSRRRIYQVLLADQERS